MNKNSERHVPALSLWQCACKSRGLSASEHRHVIICVACQTLAIEMGAALEAIEVRLGRSHSDLSLS